MSGNVYAEKHKLHNNTAWVSLANTGREFWKLQKYKSTGINSNQTESIQKAKESVLRFIYV